MQSQTKKIAISSVLIALAIIFSYVEVLIPFNFGIPGMKLGIPNIVVILALYTISASSALEINCIRIILVSAMFGSFSMAIYSFAGGFLSFGVMYFLKRTNKFSIIGVSMAGGAFHNIGQLLMAAAIVENIKMLYSLPLLMIIGMITGIIIGIISHKIIKNFE
ncbi:Gx transporter family protein [Anaerovorax odorimutans]|uniref:Gx transporter family protein n=1 Tax=Anaerovorax odorimutans TaxID=109327 RepID=UPI0004111551|nr:Gx transporter family protein [Anaerovorax odorimutans]